MQTNRIAYKNKHIPDDELYENIKKIGVDSTWAPTLLKNLKLVIRIGYFLANHGLHRYRFHHQL